MSKLNKAFGGTGIAAAMIAAVALSGCDPYTGANTSPPQILGVIVADLNLNGIQPAECTAPVCQAANGTGSHTICASNPDCTVAGETCTVAGAGLCSTTTTVVCAADTGCPAGETCVIQGCSADFDCRPDSCQLADHTGSHTACTTNANCTAPETCQGAQTCQYTTKQASGSAATCDFGLVGNLTPPTGCIYSLPARTGGIWGPGYPAAGAGTWTVSSVPVGAGGAGWPGISTQTGFQWAFGQIRVIFNKLMDGATIQTDPAITTPPAGSDFKIVETIGAVNTTVCDPNGTPAVPCQFDVYYDPSSPTPNYGAAMVVQPSTYNGGVLLDGASYHITATTVKDHEGRAIPVDVTVTTVQ